MAHKSVIKLAHISAFFPKDPALLLKAENSYECGHVVQCNFDPDIRYMTAKVKPSMKKGTYDVEIDFAEDGTIKKATCECAAGQAKCHHMAAALLHGHHNISVTDRTCQWSKRKTEEDDKVKTIDEMFPNKKKKALFEATESVSVQKKQNIFQMLREAYGLHVGFSWILSPEAPESTAAYIHNLEATLLSVELRNAPDKTTYLCEKVKVDAKQCAIIERATVGQGKNSQWLIAKRKLLTSSNFERVLKAIKINSFPPSLFKTLLGAYNLEKVLAIQWGIYNEPTARNVFQEYYGMNVHSTGLFIHESGLLGASPDGLIGEECVLEIKCPYKIREEDVQKMFDPKEKYIIQRRDDGYFVDEDHPYYHQIQGQLFMTNRKRCFLMIWTLKNHMVFNIDRDEKWGGNINLLIEFYLTKFMPHILSECF